MHTVSESMAIQISLVGQGENLLEVQTRLLDTLLTKYDKRILPQHNVSDPVPLSIGIRLLNLVELVSKDMVSYSLVFLFSSVLLSFLLSFFLICIELLC